jgi:hypothetical protein
VKIAIIGGGLFGCNIASELSKLSFIKKIDLFEKNNKLFSGASSNNQHRFHTGFHYPRSPQTIKQIQETSQIFKEKFSDCLFDIKNNIYFVSKEGNIKFSEFYSIFLNDSKKIDDLSIYNSYFHIDKIEGAVLSNEKGINITFLKKKIYENMDFEKITIFLLKQWNSKLEKEYDFIINTSYIDPTLTTNKIQVKYEICNLVLLENPYDLEDYAFTIMDGPYSSLYPTENKNIYTLSNVQKTPFYKTNNFNEFNFMLKNFDLEFNLKKIEDDIVEATKEYYKLNKINKVGRYVSPKIKILNDFNDVRTTEIIFEEKTATLLQGKISTIQYVAEKIKNYLIRINL